MPADRTKNHYEHRLPLSTYLYALLSARFEKRDISNPFVFPGTGRTGFLHEPKRQIKQVIKESSVPFCSHDLRRSFLSFAESLDVSHYALKKLANHRSGGDVTQGYIVNDVERLREPMQRTTDFIVHNACLHEVNPTVPPPVPGSNVVTISSRTRRQRHQGRLGSIPRNPMS